MEIEKIIKEYIISEIMHKKSRSSLKNDESLLEKGIIDSVGLLHLITFIEERFKIQILMEGKRVQLVDMGIFNRARHKVCDRGKQGQGSSPEGIRREER